MVNELARTIALVTALFALSFASLLHAESPADLDARMQWRREARFGMFIHWGLYAIPAGEWEGKDSSGIGE